MISFLRTMAMGLGFAAAMSAAALAQEGAPAAAAPAAATPNAAALAASTPAAGAVSTTSGVYTKAQADRGLKLYFENCASCHGDQMQGVESDPGFADNEFDRRWAGKPTSYLFDYILRLMPPGRPGALGNNGAADVVAYILAFNGAPEGQAELPGDNVKLKEITTAPSSRKQ